MRIRKTKLETMKAYGIDCNNMPITLFDGDGKPIVADCKMEETIDGKIILIPKEVVRVNWNTMGISYERKE